MNPTAIRMSPVAVSVCADCIVTQILVWRRAADGAVQVFGAQWDVVSASSIQPVVRQLHDEVMVLIRQ